MTERHVKLFKNGRNQGVRIPRDFELPGEDAIIRKDGQRLIIEPAPPRSLLALPTTLRISADRGPSGRAGRFLAMGFPLDTNILSDLVRRPRGRIADRTAEVGEQMSSQASSGRRIAPRKPTPVQRGGAAQAYAASGNRFIGAEMELIR
jgi:antitoxin VapB